MLCLLGCFACLELQGDETLNKVLRRQERSDMDVGEKGVETGGSGTVAGNCCMAESLTNNDAASHVLAVVACLLLIQYFLLGLFRIARR